MIEYFTVGMLLKHIFPHELQNLYMRLKNMDYNGLNVRLNATSTMT